jgi:urease accessory protein
LTLKLVLTFEQRQKSRLRVQPESGAEASFLLPRGEVRKAGERITSTDGRQFEVACADERLLHVEADDLVRVAYHLGNRHVPVQMGKNFLRIAEDHVLEELAKKLGAKVSHVEAPFEPEPGAYAGGHHTHDEMGHGGKIHDHFDHHH